LLQTRPLTCSIRSSCVTQPLRVGYDTAPFGGRFGLRLCQEALALGGRLSLGCCTRLTLPNVGCLLGLPSDALLQSGALRLCLGPRLLQQDVGVLTGRHYGALRLSPGLMCDALRLRPGLLEKTTPLRLCVSCHLLRCAT
jgi:hypothetical protein